LAQRYSRATKLERLGQGKFFGGKIHPTETASPRAKDILTPATCRLKLLNI